MKSLYFSFSTKFCFFFNLISSYAILSIFELLSFPWPFLKINFISFLHGWMSFIILFLFLDHCHDQDCVLFLFHCWNPLFNFLQREFCLKYLLRSIFLLLLSVFICLKEPHEFLNSHDLHIFSFFDGNYNMLKFWI